MKNLTRHFRVPGYVAAALIASGVLLFVDPAEAGPCDQRGMQIASSRGAHLLGARAQGDKCHIRLLVRSKKGPPKRMTIVVSK